MSAGSLSYTALPFTDLLGRFASSEPAPGGGSASALAGAVAASLAQMVGGLTEGKLGYEAVSAECATLRTAAATLATRLSEAVTADAQAFDGVVAAMALSKATDEEKAVRRDVMQHALKRATLAPLGVAMACVEVAQLALRLLDIGNKNASTDAAVGVLLALAGAEGSLLNVEINLGSIKDEAWVGERRDEADGIWEELEALRSDLWPGIRAHGLTVPR